MQEPRDVRPHGAPCTVEDPKSSCAFLTVAGSTVTMLFAPIVALLAMTAVILLSFWPLIVVNQTLVLMGLVGSCVATVTVVLLAITLWMLRERPMVRGLRIWLTEWLFFNLPIMGQWQAAARLRPRWLLSTG